MTNDPQVTPIETQTLSLKERIDQLAEKISREVAGDETKTTREETFAVHKDAVEELKRILINLDWNYGILSAAVVEASCWVMLNDKKEGQTNNPLTILWLVNQHRELLEDAYARLIKEAREAKLKEKYCHCDPMTPVHRDAAGNVTCCACDKFVRPR